VRLRRRAATSSAIRPTPSLDPPSDELVHPYIDCDLVARAFLHRVAFRGAEPVALSVLAVLTGLSQAHLANRLARAPRGRINTREPWYTWNAIRDHLPASIVRGAHDLRDIDSLRRRVLAGRCTLAISLHHTSMLGEHRVVGTRATRNPRHSLELHGNDRSNAGPRRFGERGAPFGTCSPICALRHVLADFRVRRNKFAWRASANGCQRRSHPL